ncbi:MAG: bifunctional nuclease family protein [Planctomycetota bacterium]
MTVRMELSRILIRELVDHQIIELRELGASKAFETASDDLASGDDVRTFPIVIGLPEAQAIERRLKGVKILRPQTHDLLHSVIESLGASLVSVHITDLNDHTFYAQLRVRKADGEVVEIDSRPSDAIALGIGGGVPIFVEEHVLDSAARDPEDD